MRSILAIVLIGMIAVASCQLMEFCSIIGERHFCKVTGVNGPEKVICNMPGRNDDPSLDCPQELRDSAECCQKCCTHPTPWGTWSPWCDDERLTVETVCSYLKH